jgi:hypothetical protein
MSGISIPDLGFRAIAAVLLLSVAVVQGQDLSVSPTGWDYGNVVAGASETVTFDLQSMGPSAVWTYVIALSEASDWHDPSIITPYDGEYVLGAFSFNPATLGPLPLEMPIGSHYLVDIAFTPPAPGYYSAYFGVQSNDSIEPPGPHAWFRLEGTSVSAVPVPGALLLVGLGTGVVGLMRRRLA